MGYIILLAMVFVVIAIVKNKKDEYIKQISFAAMILSILNCLIIARAENSGMGSARYFGMAIGYDAVSTIFNISIVILLISLIVYLFTDAKL